MDNGQYQKLYSMMKQMLQDIKKLSSDVSQVHHNVRSIKNKTKGFSLVELMIVVGILGILTAIAIPNFQRFQARSRQSEAKAGLSAIHTAAHAFHAEWEVYAGALQPIGWVPAGKEFRYAIGFEATLSGFCGVTANAISGGAMLMCGPAPGREYRGNVENPTVTLTGGLASGTTTYAMAGTTHNITYVGVAAQGAAIAVAGTDNANENDGMISATAVTTDVDANFFTAGAVGNPLGYDDPMTGEFDYWSIDEEKNLETRLGATLDDDL